MTNDLIDQLERIQKALDDFSHHDPRRSVNSGNSSFEQELRREFTKQAAALSELECARAFEEFFGLGPLTAILEEQDWTELLINGIDSLWMERRGHLTRAFDRFLSERTYRNILNRLSDEAHCHLSLDRPLAQGEFRNLRLQMVGASLTAGSCLVSLRRHPSSPWTFDRLRAAEFASGRDLDRLKEWILNKKNFLVVGATGSGKTSVLDACLQSLPEDERVVLIEDTLELTVPNAASARLRTRFDTQGQLIPIELGDLVRTSLRLRPDRLVVGEIRGAEAKDLLMALSTGHAGSWATLHASNPHQALIRLEMLVQLGAPNWSVNAVRRLIQLSLSGIVVLKKDSSGRRLLEGLYEISSLEDHGFLIQRA